MPDRHPLNAPGPFYVVDGDCAGCGMPQILAPDLMCSNEELGTVGHCYLKRQPYTAGEFEQTLRVIDQNCCGAVRYSGKDPLLLATMRARGLAEYCDPGPNGEPYFDKQ